MTKEDLDIDKEIIARATPGPWEHHNWDVMTKPHVVAPSKFDGTTSCNGHFDVPLTTEDAEFISAARTRWPLAIEEIERLQRSVERLEKCAHEKHEWEPDTTMTVMRCEHCYLEADKRGENQKLRAEIERLQAEVAVARERFGPAGYNILQEHAQLKAENEKLRNVLTHARDRIRSDIAHSFWRMNKDYLADDSIKQDGQLLEIDEALK